MLGRLANVRSVSGAMICAGLLAAGGARALTQEEILNYKGADRDQVLLDGAKKEGEVVFYASVIVNQALRPIAEGFMKKYPSIKMGYWRADAPELIAKITAESRARNIVADVIEGTGMAELAIAGGLVQPYQTPVTSEYPPQYRDPRNMWTSTRLSYFSLAYSTKNVAPADIPKTYDDLLDPKWQGRLAWRVGSVTGTELFITNLRMAWGEEKAMAYFRKLAGQKMINFGSGSARTLVDRVMAGEFPLALNIFAHHPLISAQKGAPVNSQLMDPVPSSPSTMAVMKDLRHPHAAMLLVDFVLSKEGQGIMAKAEYFPSRPDVPALPHLQAVVPLKAGVPENFISPENMLKYAEGSNKIYQDLFR